MFSNILLLFSSKLFPSPASLIIWAPIPDIISFISSGILPFKHCIVSNISNVFPTARPTGSSIFVSTHTVSLFANVPISFIIFEIFMASSFVFINAPLPTVTSSTIFSAPAAIFLLIMLDAISGILPTQEIESLSAYNFLSAGAKFAVWPITLIPTFCTFSMNLFISTTVLYPGIDSSLSIVPPVNPNPLPDIFATGIPSDAIIGINTIVILSPTPPVECLSTTVFPKTDKSNISPELAISKVKFVVSSFVIPFKYIAITRAAAW